MATEVGGQTRNAQGRSGVRGSTGVPPGGCPHGLLPTLGPWALVPARELSGTLALLPEPPQAISRHKILRPAKSHNMSVAKPQVTFCPTPQLPTRGFLEKGPALCWSTFPCGQHILPACGQAWLPHRQDLGTHFSHRPDRVEPEAGQPQGLLRPPPGLLSQGSFLHLGKGHQGLN